jgi:CRP-like cAMP-binding protein
VSNPLILKLEHGAHLTDADRTKLREVSLRTRQIGAHQDLIQEGDRPEDVRLVLDGLACRYKLLSDGSRQIMALLVPGDFCDLHVAILGEMDHAIATLSACTMVEISRNTVLDLTLNHPRIAHALLWATLVDEGVLREWLVGAGKRDADHRTAHLFCELLVRLQAVGRADENSYELPLTQAELADLLGLSEVHVNRTLQALREADLIVLRSKHLTIPDVERLKAFAQFTPNYLHLVKRANGNGADGPRTTALPAG